MGRAKAATFGQPRAITAGARRLTKKELTTTALSESRASYMQWQRESWVAYDRIGEVHFGFNFVANTLSRIRIYAAAAISTEEVPASVDVAREAGKITAELARAAEAAMADFIRDDFSSQLRLYALNMGVVGECLLVELPDVDAEPNAEGNKPNRWYVRSTDEIRVEADRIVLVPRRDLINKQNEITIIATRRNGNWAPEPNIGRIWRQHPQYSEEPDSSMRALADPVEELLLSQRLVRSSTRSRLNAGLVFVPEGITTMSGVVAPSEPAVDELGFPVSEPAVVEQGNTFLDDLIDAMLEPVSDEGAPSAVVPMVTTGPGELGAQIRHMTFERNSDEWLAGRAERALERILQGIDVPKDIVTGLANVKYANAMQIDEGMYKSTIEPLALTLVDALTAIYLRPALLAEGFSEEDVSRIVVWYDPVEIVTRPNQADDATKGYDRYLVSADSWRKANGFSETDAPTEEELAQQLLLAKGSLPEDVTVALLNVVFPKVLGKQRDANIAKSAVPFPDSAKSLLNPGEEPATPPGETVDTPPEPGVPAAEASA